MPDSKFYEGGGFLIAPSEPLSCSIPEQLDVSAKEMAQAAASFYDKYVAPKEDALEKGDLSHLPTLLDQAAAHGLLGVSVPEEYGGISLSTRDSLLITEALGKSSSFSTTYGVHTGIGVLPILYYGNETLRKKYLSKIVSAEYKPCYCLTEPEAGSDVASGCSRATLKGDTYLLNGQKIWISNAGFANMFIVFAKVEGDDRLSAFVVEKSFGGIELQAEEHKLGLKGSSTRQVFFSNCPVPKENMLAEQGQGFKIAVNILNSGRLKLAAGAAGTAKCALAYAIQHAKGRKQFGQSLSSFGAVQQKIAQMLLGIYACESAVYRTGGAIDAAISRRKAEGLSPEEATLRSMEAYAIECALLKVYGSETLDYVVDEALQIYGGMGFSEEAPIARMYRDARVTRIYEGTNEINRMLAVGQLLRRAEKGLLPLLERAKAVGDSLLQVPSLPTGCEGPLQQERQQCEKLKEVLLLVVGRAAQLLGKNISQAQELLLYAAEITIQIYVSESALLRAAHLQAKQLPRADLATLSAQICLYEATSHIQTAAEHIIDALPTNQEEKKMLAMGCRRLCKRTPFDSITAKRTLAVSAISREGYLFTNY